MHADEFRELVHGTNAAAKLARLRFAGDASALLGKDWAGFRFGSDGKLYPPFFRGGFTALQICGMFFEMQELRHLRREVRRLERELVKLKEEAWAAGKVREAVRQGERVWRG